MLKSTYQAINRVMQFSVIILIKMYRYIISPCIGRHCRFFPSCSQYAEKAVTQFGVLRGMFLTIKRLLKCHPFHRGGYDPLPNHNESKLWK